MRFFEGGVRGILSPRSFFVPNSPEPLRAALSEIGYANAVAYQLYYYLASFLGYYFVLMCRDCGDLLLLFRLRPATYHWLKSSLFPNHPRSKYRDIGSISYCYLRPYNTGNMVMSIKYFLSQRTPNSMMLGLFDLYYSRINMGALKHISGGFVSSLADLARHSSLSVKDLLLE